MKWLVAAGLLVLPLAALLATRLSQPPSTARLPLLLTSGQPAPALGADVVTTPGAAQ